VFGCARRLVESKRKATSRPLGSDVGRRANRPGAWEGGRKLGAAPFLVSRLVVSVHWLITKRDNL